MKFIILTDEDDVLIFVSVHEIKYIKEGKNNLTGISLGSGSFIEVKEEPSKILVMIEEKKITA